MKKALLLGLITLGCVPLSACNNDIGPGTHDFTHAYVCSSITGSHYYKIKRWKEYNPEPDNGLSNWYVGLEITTSKGIVYYWYEQGLHYVLTKGYVADFGTEVL